MSSLFEEIELLLIASGIECSYSAANERCYEMLVIQDYSFVADHWLAAIENHVNYLFVRRGPEMNGPDRSFTAEHAFNKLLSMRQS